MSKTAGQAVPAFHQDFRRAHQDGRVAVVTAGVRRRRSVPELAGRRRPNGTTVFSVTGRASMSARSRIVGPGNFPSITATTPVCAIPVRGSRPSERKCSATSRRCALAVREFGISVKVPPPFDDFRLDRRRGGVELGAVMAANAAAAASAECEGHQ
jgi:hypothetical protein